jgi:hypothetical protein
MQRMLAREIVQIEIVQIETVQMMSEAVGMS